MLAKENQRIAGFRRRQSGLVSRDQLLALGAPGSTIQAQVERGVLEIWQRGVYGPAGLEVTWERRHWAALLGAGADARLAGRSAAAALGLMTRSARSPVELIIPPARRVKLARVTVRRVALDEADRIDVGLMPCTTASRAIVDLAGALGRRTTKTLAIDAWRRNLTSPDEIALTLQRAGTMRGAKAVRLLLAELDESYRRCVNGGEVAAYAVVRHVFSEPPRVNMRIDLPTGERYRVDFCWTEMRLIIEFDGKYSHSIEPDRAADARREALLEANGWFVLRITWEDLRNPEQLATRLRAAVTVSRRW